MVYRKRIVLDYKLQSHPLLPLLKDLISYYIRKFLTSLIAPFYYHFWNYGFVIELISTTQEVADIVGLYLLSFFVITAIILYRNVLFQAFNFLFFKNYGGSSGRLPLLNYIYTFFNSFVNAISHIINKARLFFKKFLQSLVSMDQLCHHLSYFFK